MSEYTEIQDGSPCGYCEYYEGVTKNPQVCEDCDENYDNFQGRVLYEKEVKYQVLYQRCASDKWCLSEDTYSSVEAFTKDRFSSIYKAKLLKEDV